MNHDQFTRENALRHRAAETLPEWLVVVRSQVESLRFGTVQITVHDSKVVQIERNEKTRLDRSHPG
jgi:hypothetical protein